MDAYEVPDTIVFGSVSTELWVVQSGEGMLSALGTGVEWRCASIRGIGAAAGQAKDYR